MIIGIILLVVLLAIVVVLFIGPYNKLVGLRNKLQEAWRQVDVELNRRYDLIPSLVETVKGYAAYERTTLADVKEACRQAKIVSQAMIIASPTIGARQWSTLTKSRLYDASFTHRFRRASEEGLVDMAVGKLNPRSETRVPEGQTKTTLSDEASDDNLQ